MADKSLNSGLRSVFETFESLCEMLAAENWPSKETTKFETKRAFEKCQLVDKALAKLERNGSKTEFLSIFNRFLERKGSNVKDFEFASAGDALFKKILISDSPTDLIEFVFEEYLSVYSEKQLKALLSDVLCESTSLNIAVKYAVRAPLTQSKKDDIKYKLLLRNWTRMHNIDTHITKLLRDSYSIEILEFLIKILLDKSAGDIFCQSVEKGLHRQLKERCKSDANLWYDIIATVDKRKTEQLCIDYQNIYKAIVDFLINIGSTMTRERSGLQTFWINNRLKSLCPQLSFFDVVDFTRGVILKDTNLMALFFETVDHSGGSFWDAVLKDQ